ncbi:MAG: sporulation protein YtfJ [Ruminococcaceae bacterium]|nr:sporulation protein YtfJ [Oscillospiraceae bacterium]
MSNEIPLKQVIDATLENLKNIMSTDTVIGEPKTVLEDTVIIPVSKVSVGFTSGGVDFDGKKTDNKHFGGGNGAGMSVSPIAFLVISKNGVELLNINKESSNSLADTVSDFVTKSPELITRLKAAFKKDKKEEPAADNTAEDKTKE